VIAIKVVRIKVTKLIQLRRPYRFSGGPRLSTTAWVTARRIRCDQWS